MWGLNLLALAVLGFAHRVMDQTLNPAISTILNPKSFDLLHKLYVGTSSGQWTLSLLMLFLMLYRWNKTDTTTGNA